MVVVAIGLCLGVGWSWRDALEAFVVTNAVMGVAFARCGSIIAWHRPRNPIGWLFLAGGIATPRRRWWRHWARAARRRRSVGAVRLTVTVFGLAWPWAIGFCLPLAVLLFPDGRPPTRGGDRSSSR